jgi:DNA polymerase III subunit epsilon
MREIVIDTETTGLDPLDGHRAVDIGAIVQVKGLAAHARTKSVASNPDNIEDAAARRGVP